MTSHSMCTHVFSTLKWILLFFAAIVMFIIASCRSESREEKIVEAALKTRLDVSSIGEVIHSDSTLSFSELRNRFRHISVVYLQDGCAPCYPKYINWHQRIDTIPKADDYTVLFIINTSHYEIFRRQLSRYGEVDEKYYYFIDQRNDFYRANSSIPRTVLDRSLLIDRNSRIKMVGEPFINGDMTKVFHLVTRVDN